MNDYARAFHKGIEEFNQHQFFECHETLEALWREDKTEEREFLQGIIQLAVAYHHYLHNNKPGAIKLLRKGLGHMQKFGPSCKGIDVLKLVAAVEGNLTELSLKGSAAQNKIKIPAIPFSPLTSD
jgi:predicted metal-dependent hydrolase